MKYKVVLVTAGQPLLNPRLVKEADTLVNNGYEVTVIYAYWNAWGTQLDEALLASKKWKAIRAGGDPVQKPFIYLLSRLIFKAANWVTRLTGSTLMARMAISRSCIFLERAVMKHRADIYIGHNLGALPAVVRAAKKYHKPCGFDAEDFHRNEVTNDERSLDVKLKTAVEDKYISQLQYLSVSSPLIGAEYRKYYPQIKQRVLLNTFPKCSFTSVAETANPTLKLFWFSQTLGTHRGIEQIISALQELKYQRFELHLLGDANPDIRKTLADKMMGTKSTIHFYQPIPPDDIYEFAAQFDIGIASENNTPLNRDICLTNKIFTYLQAGLCILVSNTRAQAAFIDQYNVAARRYDDSDVNTIVAALMYYQSNREALVAAKMHNYTLGQTTINWDTEEQQFLSLVQQTISA